MRHIVGPYTLMNGTPYSLSLPLDFVPSNAHVIIGKGKKYSRHSGNIRLRKMVAGRIESYAQAGSKSDKSDIISEVMFEVRSSSTYGGFVRKDPDNGRWVQAEVVFARERISQLFRDELHMYYKSSRKNRRKTMCKDVIGATNKTTTESGGDKAFSSDEDSARKNNKAVAGGSFTEEDGEDQRSMMFDINKGEDGYDSSLMNSSTSTNIPSSSAEEAQTTRGGGSIDWYDRLSNFLQDELHPIHHDNNDDPFEPRPIRTKFQER